MVDQLTINGKCDEKFAQVRDAFAANFESGKEVGASFSATVEGETVVDLWGGYTDARTASLWERDTIANVWSTTKIMTSTCAHMLVDRGLLEIDKPVSSYWPEFGQAGKENIPVRYILTHQSGVSSVEEPLPIETFYDWDLMVAKLAAQKPLWEPGTRHGYHALSFGYLVGELVRRITGKTLGQFFREEVAQPLGADFHIGLAPEDHARAATMIAPSQLPPPDAPAISSGDTLETKLRKLMSNPPISGRLANKTEWRSAEIPAANGHGNARSVARVLAVLACGGQLDGVRLMSTSTIESAIEEQVYGPDLVLGSPMRWGLGFMLVSKHLPVSPNPRAFGHGGWGGSLGIADMDARASWAYVMNKMDTGTTGDIRAGRLGKAFYKSLSQ